MLGLVAVGLFALVGGTIYIVVMVYLTAQHHGVQVSGLKMNDGDVAKDEFLQLLGTAREWMFIVDDGDHVDDSIYEDRKILDRILKKLDEFTDFRIYCLFNEDHKDLEFRRRFDSPQFSDRVFIRTVDQEPRIRTHCKMIDKGLQAHLSWHLSGAKQRLYKTVDCSGTLAPLRARVIRNSLGEQLDTLERFFPNRAFAS